ncbi:hypothetical protein D9M68_937730 [compost metagenome]
MTDIGSLFPAAVQASSHSRTTGTLRARGTGTVSATDTPLASGPRVLASWLAPAKERLVTMVARCAAFSRLTICAAGA